MTRVLFVLFSFMMMGSVFSQDDALLGFILANEDACVKSYDEDKIYLKSNCIVSTEKGLVFALNGTVMPISTLHSDSQGPYIKPMQPYEILNRCKGCGSSYFIYCRTPGCRYNPDTPK